MSLYLPKHSRNWVVVFKHKGKWFRKSSGTPDKKKALEIEKEYRKRFVDEGKGIRGPIKLKDAIDAWELSMKGTSSYANISRAKKVLCDFLLPSTTLDEITTKDLLRFVNKHKEKYSNSTIKHWLQALRSSINLAYDSGHTVSDLKYPKLKTVRGRTRVLSDDEMQAIANELHPDKAFGTWHVGEEAKRFRQDAYDMWNIFCDTGARFTEISKLEWSQVDLKGRTILLYRPKVDNETRLVMTDRVYEIFKRRSRNPASRKYVFTNRKGKARGYTGSAIRNAIKRAGLGKDVTPHVVRHTVATRLLESGMNLQEVQYIMGHADQSTTARYLHASTQESARRAAKALGGKDKPMLQALDGGVA